MGSVTYEAGGFELPFYIFGGLDLILAIVGVFVVPNVKSVRTKKADQDADDSTGKRSLTLTAVIKVFCVVLYHII